MKYKRNFLVLLLIAITLFLSLVVFNVSADSGWDTDYDSGSSWDSDLDSGSDWDSDWDSNNSSGNYYGSGSSTSDIKDFLPFLIIIGFLFAMWVIKNLVNDSKHDKSKGNTIGKAKFDELPFKEITQEQANIIVPNFDIEEFKIKAYQIFKDIQIYWMNFDYDNLRILLTDELYNTYEMDLEVLKTKNQINVMNGFEKKFIKLVNLKKENDQFIATVILNVEFYDYIENQNGKVVRGNKIKKVDNLYTLTFVKSTEKSLEKICPNCGAKLEGNTIGVCEYCKSKLIFDEYDWVMSKKTKISQR